MDSERSDSPSANAPTGAVTINIYMTQGGAIAKTPEAHSGSPTNFKLLADATDFAAPSAAMPTVKLADADAYWRVLQVMGKVSGRRAYTFTDETVLRDPPAQNGAGIADKNLPGLAPYLTESFADVEAKFTVEEIFAAKQKMKTVGDLTDFVWKKIPEVHRQEAQR